MTKVTIDTQFIDFDAAAKLMDETIREQVYAVLAPCGEQEFLDAYCIAHLAVYGEDFIVN